VNGETSQERGCLVNQSPLCQRNQRAFIHHCMNGLRAAAVTGHAIRSK
jgi:hypothetical protein